MVAGLMEPTMSKDKDTSRELTADELDAVSGGAANAYLVFPADLEESFRGDGGTVFVKQPAMRGTPYSW
jgi:hypothetical protein